MPVQTNQQHNGYNEAANSSRRAAQYLQRLEDGRTFARYAERAFAEASEMAPDSAAFGEAVALRGAASSLRKRATEFKQNGNARFNPKRRMRRVVIDKRPETE